MVRLVRALRADIVHTEASRPMDRGSPAFPAGYDPARRPQDEARRSTSGSVPCLPNRWIWAWKSDRNLSSGDDSQLCWARLVGGWTRSFLRAGRWARIVARFARALAAREMMGASLHSKRR